MLTHSPPHSDLHTVGAPSKFKGLTGLLNHAALPQDRTPVEPMGLRGVSVHEIASFMGWEVSLSC